MTRITIEDRGTGVVAFPWGKSAPILRPVPGNAYLASAAWWPTRDAALEEMGKWFGPIEVMPS